MSFSLCFHRAEWHYRTHFYTQRRHFAERDRLLDDILSEFYALRQEIATFMWVLFDGRGSVDSSRIDTLFSRRSNPLGRLGGSEPTTAGAATCAGHCGDFWLWPRHQLTHATVVVSTSLGRVMPVSRVVMPEMTVGVVVVSAQLNGAGGKKLQENMNPMMKQPRAKDVDVNGSANANAKVGARAGGFDGYAGGSVFRMKTTDAYRMHLWGEMATMRRLQEHQHLQQQQQPHQQQQTPHLTGLASWMRPTYFSAPTLGGKHAGLPVYQLSPPPPYTTTPPLPSVSFAKHGAMEKMERERERVREKERELAMAATLASQTLLNRFGVEFWDAFVAGGTASSVSPVASSLSLSSLDGGRLWDADKARKVLEVKLL